MNQKVEQLSRLLSDLRSLACDSFHATNKGWAVKARHVFLRFISEDKVWPFQSVNGQYGASLFFFPNSCSPRMIVLGENKLIQWEMVENNQQPRNILHYPIDSKQINPSMASSSSSSSRSWEYDVFLSFRGTDTRDTFVDHLYSALVQQGIYTYKDDQTLPPGETIGPSLLKAIEESQIAVVVFSENYADSSWCLQELAHIMKCKHERGLIVIPIFYHVDPSELRNQKRKYGEAFEKHELEKKNVESWRKALKEAGNLSGYVANGPETVFIKQIVDTISNRLCATISSDDEDLIGIKGRLQDLKSKLAIDSRDVVMVGIWGLGGGGKTTLASALYDEISTNFDGSCFIKDVREESSKHGLPRLQKEILLLVLKLKAEEVVGDVGRLIKSRFRRKKVLMVLDDVDHLDQLKELAGSNAWFGEGSRIIITTRDNHLLTAHGVNMIYNISLLNHDEAIKLFRKHAPRRNRPLEDYEMLSKDVVSYACGLPLALKVLGSFLCDKDMSECMSALARLKEIPDGDIVQKLKISYDGLKPMEKELFLDIACFFRGHRKDEIMVILEACGFYPVIGIKVLTQKALITVSKKGTFEMHDLIQEMAHYIVRGENLKSPEKHSRVWQEEDVVRICAMDSTKVNDSIKALKVWFTSDRQFPPSLPEVVGNMKRLRWISWFKYPATSLPREFQPMELCYLKLEWSRVEQLWEGNKHLPNLKVLDLGGSHKLYRTPNLDGLPCLERLILSHCGSLKEIHPSVGYHERIIFLDLHGCSDLEIFPPITRMKKLETLRLSKCFKLRKFPEIQTSLDNLVKLTLHDSGIEIVPSSVGRYCTNLVTLDIRACCDLESIEGNFHRLKHLKGLYLDGCDHLMNILTESLFDVECSLQLLSLSGTSLQNLHRGAVNGFLGFSRFLRRLNLRWCNLVDGHISPVFCKELTNLEALDLSCNKFSQLHSSLSQLPRLKFLNLSSCKSLVELPDLPSSISVLIAQGCYALDIVGDFPTSDHKWLWKVSLTTHNKSGDGGRIVQSMLQGNAVEDYFISILLCDDDHIGNYIPIRGFALGTFTLQLPQNWYSEFSGFLVYIDECYFGTDKVIIKDVLGMENEDEVLEVSDKTEDDEDTMGARVVWYISFGSLRNTSWWNSTHDTISFFIEGISNLKVDLVPRRTDGDDSREREKDIAYHSNFWDEESPNKKTFEIISDSKSSIEIQWDRYTESDIVEKLKISYDGLKPKEKELFLDIACFFRGKRKKVQWRYLCLWFSVYHRGKSVVTKGSHNCVRNWNRRQRIITDLVPVRKKIWTFKCKRPIWGSVKGWKTTSNQETSSMCSSAHSPHKMKNSCLTSLSFHSSKINLSSSTSFTQSTLNKSTLQMASSSSSSSSSRSWEYDVFLSFRGTDTRNTFVDHLYSVLVQQGIYTYKDDQTLPRGETIGPSLFKAIEESQIAVVIFSENYADSSWCLQELAHIMKCKDERGQIVIPIFYHVDPSELRNQKRKYGEAIAKHESENKNVESWRIALVDAGNLSGYVAEGPETEFIKQIVVTISNRLCVPISSDDEDLIGIESRLQDLRSKMEMEPDGVLMVGIWGLVVVTTLASALYDEISTNFDGSCFVKDVREESSKHGLPKLQREIISLVLKLKTEEVIGDVGRLIKSRFRRKKVLMVLDDVDHLDQLKELAGSNAWFGKGSRIIITTRDKHLLTAHKLNVVYDISLLNEDEAMKLFCKHALGHGRPIEDYEMLSRDVVSYAHGLPLALKVMGSFLCDKDMTEWKSTLARLKDIPESDIVEKLKISYDGLKPKEKELGKKKDKAMEILDACGFHSTIGVKVLVLKALITVSKEGRFDMHDLIQEMGHYVVRGENPENPELHSRVWQEEDVLKICATDAMTKNDRIEALQLGRLRDMPHNLPQVVEASWISWDGHRAVLLPREFQPMKLCCLQLKVSLLHQLWEGYKHLPNLKVLNLSDSRYLVSTPDLDGLPCLERLKLARCESLKEIHPSLGYHERLNFLDMTYCRSLEMFPPIMRMKKLETLILSSCSKLRKLPDIQNSMDNLVKLDLDQSGVEVVPSSIGQYCTSLVSFDLSFCKRLQSIEGNFHCLKRLKGLYFGGCRQLKNIPVEGLFDVLTCVRNRYQGFVSLKPFGFAGSIKRLSIVDCNMMETCPLFFCELLNLEVLDLGSNGFSRLHSSLSQLPRLKLLDLSFCDRLVELPDLPSSLAILKANECHSLKVAGELPTNLKWLWKVSLPMKSILGDVKRLVLSMLQGDAIQDYFTSLRFWGKYILMRGCKREAFMLQLPWNWYNDFCGFLIYTDWGGYEGKDNLIRIADVMGMDYEDNVFEAFDGTRKIDEDDESEKANAICYISFSSLRHTSWWNSRHTTISFSIKYVCLKVELVPRRNQYSSIERTKDTTYCSEFWDEESPHRKTFEILHDSKSSINISWLHHHCVDMFRQI
ncbi:LOW QUALITY PROTEIN: hypothetical protein OSB04_018665 [Centaurea solstitialis]|uniref:ADP-ribosyl cyclase/cyclic ADP-ribose hydrolase n=1 Tax=Centaurea solstitialis TaxID=347529 RepID=A0AA38TH47_9ASTR|nr:LOW QUALITY PROTEIN: hypothetical protein OSB04_018665 [Centaurea solstitialis]